LSALRELYDDPEARFKSVEQAEAVQLALQGEKDMLVILPTGGGKSLVFQLPASIEKGQMTVVIIPFVALIEEMEERCTNLGISCHIWRKSDAISGPPSTQILLVAVEHAVLPDFQQSLVQLESSNKLARIVLDECHVVLTHRDFRGVVRRLASVLRCVSVQLISLTATLAVEMEDKLRITLGCERWHVIRNKGERPEIKYGVEILSQARSRRDLNGEVFNLLRSKLLDFEEDDRAIVYCLQREWARDLAKFVNERFKKEVCMTYHARMDISERREAYDKWKEGEIKVLITTSALGAGIDHPSVRLIIHHGHAGSMIDLCQETGRAGRDGQKAEAVTLFWPDIINLTGWIKREDREPILHWIRGTGCRRSAIGKYLNGTGKECLSMANGELCDRCNMALGSHEIKPLNMGRRNASRGLGLLEKEVKMSTDLKEMIWELRGRCTLCWIHQRNGFDSHELEKCR
jgi:RecQ family ATP-dependent DNA helicase